MRGRIGADSFAAPVSVGKKLADRGALSRQAIAKNRSKQKRQKAIEAKRRRSVEGFDDLPRRVHVMPLEASIDVRSVTAALHTAVRSVKSAKRVKRSGKANAMDVDEDAELTRVPCTVRVGDTRERLTLSETPQGSTLLAALDGIKVADMILFCVDATSDGIDARGDRFLSLLFAQGILPAIGVVANLAAVPAKRRHAALMAHAKALKSALGNDTRVLSLDSKPSDADVLLRYVRQMSLVAPSWRRGRAHLSATAIDVDGTSTSSAADGTCTLLLSGHVYGGRLGANQLVHLPDIGDFQLDAITQATDPCPTMRHDAISIAPGTTLDTPDERQETLLAENVPDDMDQEQTWPTAEEEAEADASRTVPGSSVKKVRVPKGFSAYQTAWLVDSDEENDSGDDDEDGDERMRHDRVGGDNDDDIDDADASHDVVLVRDGEEIGRVSRGARGGGGGASSLLGSADVDAMTDDAFGDEEDDGESSLGSKWARERVEVEKTLEELEQDEVEFPDEEDLRPDQVAREIYLGYRGLKSWRHSAWDAFENLPREYARIYRFKSFKRYMAAVRRRDEQKAVPVGSMVTLHVRNVPNVAAHQLLQRFHRGEQVMAFGLWSGEQKLSVVHAAVKRHATYAAPVPLHTPLTIQMGFRRLHVRPTFSENNVGANKQRMERFLHVGRNSCASMYAPITFTPAPVILFREPVEGDQEEDDSALGLDEPRLVATGSLLQPDPERIIVRKVVLSAVPIRVFKKSVVARGMFHNAKDIQYFKPIELWTKHGRSGHIVESTGTHGRMKCIFNGVIHQHDTICMSLYDREFPLWPYDQ